MLFRSWILGVTLLPLSVFASPTPDNVQAAIDSLLAATALQHDLTLVTRNTKDFAGLDLQLVNPWSA